MITVGEETRGPMIQEDLLCQDSPSFAAAVYQPSTQPLPISMCALIASTQHDHLVFGPAGTVDPTVFDRYST